MTINNRNANLKSWRNPEYRKRTSLAISKSKLGIRLTPEWKKNIGIGGKRTLLNKGKNHYRWGGNSISYSSFHSHIRKKFGRANRCENHDMSNLPFLCTTVSTKYEWSFIHGRKDYRNINNYRMLCISCHRRYDNLRRVDGAG